MKGRFLFIMFLYSFDCFCQGASFNCFQLAHENEYRKCDLICMESDSTYNWVELVDLLKCNCLDQNTKRVREIIEIFSIYGFGYEKLIELMQIIDLAECSQMDKKYDIYLDSLLGVNLKRIESDSIVRIINYLSKIDEYSQKINSLTKRRDYIKATNPLNYELLKPILLNENLSTERLGIDTEIELYQLCFHLLRVCPQNDFVLIIDKLKNLVDNDQMNPINFANIIDERLRYNGSKEYPKYNYLRKVKLNSEQQKLVENNRRNIQAYMK